MSSEPAQEGKAEVKEEKQKVKRQSEMKRNQDAGKLASELKEAMRTQNLGRCLELLEQIHDEDFNLQLAIKQDN